MPTTVATKLIEKLKAKQGDLSDQQFGGKLGISKQLWQMIRTGERQIPCPIILKGIAKAYPELMSDVLIFLGFDVELSSLSDGILPKPHQTHQDKQQGGLRKLLRGIYLWFRGSNRNKPTKSKSEG